VPRAVKQEQHARHQSCDTSRCTPLMPLPHTAVCVLASAHQPELILSLLLLLPRYPYFLRHG
jgi:hypothetical protein